MFRLDEGLKVYLHREAVDFRKNINGLAALVEQSLGLDPFARAVYVFRNRRADRIKLLGWERNGFWLLLKRLEQDRFSWPREAAVATLTVEQLHWLLEGIDLAAVRRHPVKFFNSHHLANCFVYADYLVEEEQVCADLDNPEKAYNGHFRGYHSVERIRLTAADLATSGWRPHVPSPRTDWTRPRIRPYAFLERLERDAGLDDSHGAPTLSILFLGADGHATYDALFCQDSRQRAPYAVVLQDHGFGGNYDRFGRRGLLEGIAITTGVFPEYLLVAENTMPWDGYVRVPGVDGSRGGGNGRLRHLYQRDPEADLGPRSWQPDERNPHQKFLDTFYRNRQ